MSDTIGALPLGTVALYLRGTYNSKRDAPALTLIPLTLPPHSSRSPIL
jgi:hypothetical protein